MRWHREFSIDALEEMLENSGCSPKKDVKKNNSSVNRQMPGKLAILAGAMKADELTRKSYWVIKAAPRARNASVRRNIIINVNGETKT